MVNMTPLEGGEEGLGGDDFKVRIEDRVRKTNPSPNTKIEIKKTIQPKIIPNQRNQTSRINTTTETTTETSTEHPPQTTTPTVS